jgi:hypothetical protein
VIIQVRVCIETLLSCIELDIFGDYWAHVELLLSDIGCI